jgi:formate-dependent nitrite reductase cytochrome c552 subunit
MITEKSTKEKVLEYWEQLEKEQYVKDYIKDHVIELTERLTRKDLICSKCGFPKNMERAPVIMDGNVLSLIEYFDGTCEECGHQKDGSTIKVVYEFWQKLANELIRRKEESKIEAYKKVLSILEKEIENIESIHIMIPAKLIGQYAEAYKEGCLDTIKELKNLLQKIKSLDTENESKTAVTLRHDAPVSKDQRNPERLGSTPKSEISKELFDISVRLREMSYGLE